MIIGESAEPVSAVISQCWHRAADINEPTPSPSEVKTFLSRLGFEPLENSFHGWRRPADDIVILDARPDNFIKTRAGIAPIDLPMLQVAAGQSR